MTTKTAQFTPGPWSVKHDNEHDETLLQNEHTTIATVWRTEPAYEANATLIAAAPELLEALRLIGCQSVGDDWTYQQAYEFIKATARKAIAKAEGR